MPFSNARLNTPEDYLARERQRAMENAQTITLNNGTPYNVGDWRAMSPEQQYSGLGITPPWLPAQTQGAPQVQPPGQIISPITPPAAQQQAQGFQQVNQQPQIPMPGQLGTLANQSILAQSNMHPSISNLIGDNWSSMFNQG